MTSIQLRSELGHSYCTVTQQDYLGKRAQIYLFGRLEMPQPRQGLTSPHSWLFHQHWLIIRMVQVENETTSNSHS